MSPGKQKTQADFILKPGVDFSAERFRPETAEPTWGRRAAFYRRMCSVEWPPGAAAGSAGTAGGRGPEWGSRAIKGPQRLWALGARWYFS